MITLGTFFLLGQSLSGPKAIFVTGHSTSYLPLPVTNNFVYPR